MHFIDYIQNSILGVYPSNDYDEYNEQLDFIFQLNDINESRIHKTFHLNATKSFFQFLGRLFARKNIQNTIEISLLHLGLFQLTDSTI